MGHFHPENEITNRFLEALDIGTSDQWILERVGIRVRRTSLPLDYLQETRNGDLRATCEAALYSNAEMGARAAELALRRAGIERDRIGLVIAGSSAPELLTPAEAARIAQRLGLEVPALDVNSACASFPAGLFTLSLMQPERLPEFVLLVAVDSLTKVTDYRDRATAVLFGDAAAAAVISPRIPGRAEILHATMGSRPSAAEKVEIPRSGYFRQDGRAVQMFAIRRTRQGYEGLRQITAAEPAPRPLHLVGHQANLRVLDQVCRRCGIPPEQHHTNVELFGNTGSASAPSVVSMSWEKWGPLDDIALIAVGGGLSWGRALLRFREGA